MSPLHVLSVEDPLIYHRLLARVFARHLIRWSRSQNEELHAMADDASLLLIERKGE